MMATSPNPAIIFPESSLDNLSPNGLLLDAPGTGPYRISEYFSGSYILLELFDDYWREKPSIEEIRYNFVSDSVTRRLGLENGLYDFIDTVSSDDIPSLSQNENVELYQGEETGSIVLVMNKKAGISQSQDFRKAVSLIADRDALMKACYGDYGYSLHSDYMDSPGIWSVDSSLDPYGKINKEKGREYLSSSYDGSTVRILSSNLSNLDKIAIALSSELEEEGVKTDLVILDWAAFIEKRKDPEEWDIYISATSRVALPLEKNYLHSSSPGGFGDTASSALLAGLASCKTIDEAAERWEDVQIMLWDYIPVIVPGHYSTVYAASTSLQGIDFTDGYHFRFATKYY